MPMDDVGATLLQAANDVLASEGPGALTVRRIANRAGVSTMNVYSRFGGKDGVVEHLFLEGFARLRNAMASVPDTDDARDDIRRCGAAYRQFARDNPTYYSVMFDSVVDFEPSPQALHDAGATLRLLADRLDRAMRLGAIATTDPLQTAAGVWATCHGIVSLERRNAGPPELDWGLVFSTTCNALLDGLAAPATTDRHSPEGGR